ncbi:MAG: hypothetical protein AB7V58_01490 [Solirubrobacterales bacterium]
MQRDEGGLVSWPPYDDEGKETASSAGRRRASPGVSTDPSNRSTGTGPGYLRRNHYTEYIDQVKELRRSGLTDEAEQLLLELIEATEAEARAKDWGSLRGITSSWQSSIQSVTKGIARLPASNDLPAFPMHPARPSQSF